ncbi:hypothetical protein H0H87_008866 [Tephrocybe sp. NHM501043]|nr:hypothetical protein H0H87_008866 [Tephrocybe sp. NHM501043]
MYPSTTFGKVNEVLKANMSAKEGLSKIHDAGYCHKNLSLHDIMVRDKCARLDQPLVTFVNLALAEKYDDDQKRYKLEEEKQFLAKFLNNPRKRGEA